MLKAFFFAIFLPPTYLSLRLLIRRAWPLWARLAAIAALYVISQVYTIDSTLFRNLSGPDMPACLLLLQIWLFTAMMLLFLLVLGWDAARLAAWALRGLAAFAGRIAGRIPTPRPGTFVPARRTFLRQGAASLGLTLGTPAVCLATSAAGVARGTALPQLHRMEAFLPQLPPALDGFCLAHITDVHIGPLTSIDWVRQLVARTNVVRPDLICLTGDLTDGRWNYQVAHGGTRIEAVREFAAFRARHGVFGCTGNHEYYSDYEGWMALYDSVGIRMLHNAGAVLEHGGARVAVAGLDDSVVAESAAQTLSGLPGRTEGIFRILMDHRPTRAAANAAAGADLQLSGHTHGGQCLGMDRIVARANSGLVRGWYTISGMPLYVSSGAGLWSGFPVRLGIPAEIACITLRKGQGDRPVMRDV